MSFFSEKALPFFAVFAQRFVAVAKRHKELVQFVAGVADDFQGLLGVGGDVEVTF